MASHVCRKVATFHVGMRGHCRMLSAIGEGSHLKVFRRAAKLSHRNAAARALDSDEYEYLRDMAAERMLERLHDITREFPVALDLGAHSGNLARKLDGHGGIKQLYMLESSNAFLERGKAGTTAESAKLDLRYISQDEEARLPFEDGTLDIVLSSLSMHWVNNLPGVLSEIKRVLKPDGVFLGVMLGGDTLQELRSSFALAEMERDGGLSPHISPMVSVADVGNLLVETGFGLPTVDTETLMVEYPDATSLLLHLERMGESNASLQMRPGARRSTLQAAMAAYQGMYSNLDGSVSATFEFIHMIGWAPAASQAKPLRRGSVSKGFGARGSGPPADVLGPSS